MTRPVPGTEPAAGEDRVTPRCVIVALLVVASCVSWRQGVYYAGGLDPVVAFKALLSLLGLALAAGTAVTAGWPVPVPRQALVFPTAFVVCSMLGALFTESTVASSLVLCARLVILMLTVYLLVRVFSTEVVLTALAIAMAAVSLIAVGTGLGSLSTGRISGGIPPLYPNEITELCSIVVLVLLWKALTTGVRVPHAALLVLLLAVIWLTGSRTGLIALLLASVVLVVQVRRIPIPAVALTLAAVPAAAYLLLGTDVVSGFVERGGSENVATLNARTVAWSAAFDLHKDFWDQWFGSGLSLVQIPVVAEFRDEQILDSSWVSALVQGGFVGLALLGGWVAYALVVAWRRPAPLRMALTALWVFVVVRSILESGLMDSTPAFAVLLLVSSAPWHAGSPAHVTATNEPVPTAARRVPPGRCVPTPSAAGRS